MAIKLLSEFVATVSSPIDADLFLIENAGAHKKITYLDLKNSVQADVWKLNASSALNYAATGATSFIAVDGLATPTNISGQGTAETYDFLAVDLTVGARASTGAANFLRFQKDSVDVIAIDSNGAIVFGDGDTAIYENSDDIIYIKTNGSSRYSFSSSSIEGTTSTRFRLLNTVATSTVPVFIVNKTAATTGLGGIAGELSAIVGGKEVINIANNTNVSIDMDGTGSGGGRVLVSGDVFDGSSTSVYTVDMSNSGGGELGKFVVKVGGGDADVMIFEWGGAGVYLNAEPPSYNTYSLVTKFHTSSHIAGKNVDALVSAPTVTEHGYVLTWNNTNGEYELVAGGGGSQTPWTSHINANGFYLYGSPAFRDGNQNEVINFTGVTNAVNNIGLTNAITNESPILEAVGDNPNIGFHINAKGTGVIMPNANVELQTSKTFFRAYDEDSIRVKHSNFYVNDTFQSGQGQVYKELYFAMLNDSFPTRRIGFYLSQPDSGSADAVGGSTTPPTNYEAVFDVNGLKIAKKIFIEGTQSAAAITDKFVLRSTAGELKELTLTGTPDATTFLRGDGSWAVPGGGGSQTPWTGDIDGATYGVTAAGSYVTNEAAGGAVMNVATTLAVPTLLPHRGITNTGVGRHAGLFGLALINSGLPMFTVAGTGYYFGDDTVGGTSRPMKADSSDATGSRFLLEGRTSSATGAHHTLRNYQATATSFNASSANQQFLRLVGDGDGDIKVKQTGTAEFAVIKFGVDGANTYGSGGNWFLQFQKDAVDVFNVDIAGVITSTGYGSGTQTGTATYSLAVDANGNIIEEALGGGFTLTDGIGTTANGTAVDLGGTITSSVSLVDTTSTTKQFLIDISAGSNYSRLQLDKSSGAAGDAVLKAGNGSTSGNVTLSNGYAKFAANNDSFVSEQSIVFNLTSMVVKDTTSSKGLVGDAYFGGSADDNAYAQQKFVTDAVAAGGGAAAVQFSWNFNTSTSTADPGSKKYSYNNATPASVTEIYVNDTNNDNHDMSTIIGALSTGDRIYLQQEDDSTIFLIANVVSAPTDNTGWFTIPVTIDSSGTIPGNNKGAVFVLTYGSASVPVDQTPWTTKINAAANYLYNIPTIRDANELTVLQFSGVGSAVNYVNISNSATGNGPIIYAAGTDTDVDLFLSPKGAGEVKLTATQQNFHAFNEDTVKVKYATWYTDNSQQSGLGQLYFETTLMNIGSAGHRAIGLYLDLPNAGSADSGGGASAHATNYGAVLTTDGWKIADKLYIEGTPSAAAITDKFMLRSTAGEMKELTLTGTPSATTYLRGDGSWATPAGGGGGWSLTGVTTLNYAATGDATFVAVDGFTNAIDITGQTGITEFRFISAEVFDTSRTSSGAARFFDFKNDGTEVAILHTSGKLDLLSELEIGFSSSSKTRIINSRIFLDNSGTNIALYGDNSSASYFTGELMVGTSNTGDIAGQFGVKDGSAIYDFDTGYFRTQNNYMLIGEITAPGGNFATYGKLYNDSADKALKWKDENGRISVVSGSESIILSGGDENSDLVAGTNKVRFRMPYGFVVDEVRISVNTAPTGSTIIVDINESGTSILSTKLTIDATEKTSTTAATAAVISDADLADDAEMSIDIDQIGSTVAGTGLKVTLIGRRT